MCGLVGLAGTIEKREHEIFADMLVFDTVRGHHSTGVGIIDHDKETRLIKRTGPGWEFIDGRAFNLGLNFQNAVLMGHNRWATKGKVTAENAHPFQHENIMGVHNGTLSNDYALIDHKFFDVDSDNLFYSFAVKGVEETITGCRGAWALVWYDKEDDTINFLRNSERPFCFTISEDRKLLMWASEPWMIHGSAGRRNVKFEKIWFTLPDTWYSYKLPKKNQPFEEPVRKEVKGLEPLPTFQGSQGGDWRNFSGGSGTSATRSPTHEARAQRAGSSDQGAKAASEKGSVIQMPNRGGVPTVIGNPKDSQQGQNGPNHYRGYHGELLSKDAFLVATVAGCAWCDKPAHWGSVVRFFEPNRHLCAQCMEDTRQEYPLVAEQKQA